MAMVVDNKMERAIRDGKKRREAARVLENRWQDRKLEEWRNFDGAEIWKKGEFEKVVRQGIYENMKEMKEYI